MISTWQAGLKEVEAKLEEEHSEMVASNAHADPDDAANNLMLSPAQMADIITEEMTEEGTLDVVEQQVALQKQERVEGLLDEVEKEEAKVGKELSSAPTHPHFLRAMPRHSCQAFCVNAWQIKRNTSAITSLSTRAPAARRPPLTTFVSAFYHHCLPPRVLNCRCTAAALWARS
jgi:hypothetical protein